MAAKKPSSIKLVSEVHGFFKWFFFFLTNADYFDIDASFNAKKTEKCRKGKGKTALLRMLHSCPPVENKDKYTSPQFTLFLYNKDMRT